MAVLSRASVPTTERALGECITKAGRWSAALEDRVWDLADRIRHADAAVRDRAEPILADLRDALGHDDHVATTPLEAILDTAYQRLLAVFVGSAAAAPVPPVPPPPPPPPPVAQPVPPQGRETIANADTAKTRIDQIRQAHPRATIEVTIRWSDAP